MVSLKTFHFVPYSLQLQLAVWPVLRAVLGNLILSVLPLRFCHVFADAILQPVYAPSAIPAQGGKYRHLPDQPGHGTVRLSFFCLPLPLK